MDGMLSLFFTVIAMLASCPARADLSVSVGAGKGIIEAPGTPFERVGAVGYQFPFATDLFVRPEVGYFADIGGSGKSSLWAAPLLGVRAHSQVGPELHIAVGPAYLQNPDNTLGGHFQFSLEGGIGMVSSDGKIYIGVAWKHLSSAGLEMPNSGRDFLVVQLRLLTF